MSAAEIRSSLARLREAGARLRQRRAVEVLDSLSRLLELWRDERSAPRELLITELPEAAGFSAPTVREGLARALDGWGRPALLDLVQRELGGAAALDGRGERMVTGFPTTALLLGGALPMPSLLGILGPLVLRSPVLVRTASRDPLTARLVLRSLATIDSDLAECVALTSFPHDDAESLAAFLEADCIVATGSDATVRAIATQVAPPRRLVCHGHRVSVAALGPEAQSGAPLEHAVRRLALDVALWDQQGCLSPIALYVANAETKAAEHVAERLAAALDEAESRWPRGRIEPAAAAQLAHERAEAELRAASGSVSLREGEAWTVVREADAQLRPAPLHRFVRVHPVAGVTELLGTLRPLGPHLAAVGIAGFEAEGDGLARGLAELGAARLCPLGTLQSPPLAWCHDGQGVLPPIARFTDREPEGPE